MQPWSKEVLLKAIKANKPIRFVETIEEVEDYCNQQIYAIQKDSPNLRDLLKENKFPVDSRILNLRKGYYHIIEIYSKEIELKSEIRNIDIAYALYKETESGKYWNYVYQVKLKPLTNIISVKQFNSPYNIFALVGKTICVKEFNLDSETHSYKVIWYDLESRDNLITSWYEYYAEEGQMLDIHNYEEELASMDDVFREEAEMDLWLEDAAREEAMAEADRIAKEQFELENELFNTQDEINQNDYIENENPDEEDFYPED